jgi:hypothetical protein
MFFLSVQGCSFNNENPLIGKWVSTKDIFSHLNPKHKVIQLEFRRDTMLVNEKLIPIIYKVKKDSVIIFTRGEQITAYLQKGGTILLFIPNLGKKFYKKVISF